VEKAPDAFRTISEVATDLNVPQHVLRFWESRFNEIKPMKRGGGRRYYRPDDVDLLRGIRHLLYGQGYTIRGVQRILKEQGLKFVQTVWQPGAPSLGRPTDEADFSAEEGDAREREESARGRGLFSLLPSLIGNAKDDPAAKDSEKEEEEDEDDDDAIDEDGGDEDEDEDDDEEEDEEDSSDVGETLRPLALRRPAQPAGGALRAAISADDMRKLESALRELAECRRLLDAAVEEV